MTIGKRLIEERKRLGLKQGEFARQSGVSLSTQKRYEIDEREPGVSYLECVRKLGVDVTYILTGNQRDIGFKGVSFELFGELGVAVVKLLGINRDELVRAASDTEMAMKKQFEGVESDSDTQVAAWEDSFFINASEMLRRKIAAQAGKLDQSILEAVIQAVESAGKTLPLDKKAKLIAMLYRASLQTGQVETGLLTDIIAFSDG